MTAARTRSSAFSVAAAPSSCTQLHCSRMLAISTRYGLRPAVSAARRNVGSCMRGLQAATTTRSSPWSPMSWAIISCPGLEHMYLYERATTTPGMADAASATASQSTTLAMLVPQLQMKTPVRGSPWRPPPQAARSGVAGSAPRCAASSPWRARARAVARTSARYMASGRYARCDHLLNGHLEREHRDDQREVHDVGDVGGRVETAAVQDVLQDRR